MVPAPTPRCRITWTQPLVDSLLELSEEAEPTRRGYHARLQDYWNLSHPTLPSTSAALVAKLSRTNKSAQEAERVLHQWKAEMRERSEPTTEDEPLDREVALGIALLKLSSWKAPGPDGIQGYWLRVFPRACNLLKTHFWKILDEEDNMPDWLIRGRTVLIPKEGSTGSPDQYRRITCLNTMYKLFTSVLTRILMHHVSSKNLLPVEQKALRSKTRGCLDALVIDAAVAQESKTYVSGFEKRGIFAQQ